MTILNLYQAALMITIAGVALAARWAKRQMEAEARVVMDTAEPASTPCKTASESLRALNQLFDDNLISVDEYVERRRQVLH